eukprot:scaffold7608_cov62-Phaeocystis_antarctica.AAC.1
MQQQHREVAERAARIAAQSGDEYPELLAEGARYATKDDWRREARAYRKAIALRPDRPEAYFNLGAALNSSGHYVEAAQRFLEAKERMLVGSERWADATARAFNMLTQKECAEVAKPEWWNDEGLKALSARVVRVAPDEALANAMRAMVLSVMCGGWEVGPRSAAELKEAAAHFERAAALHHAPAGKANLTGHAARCHRLADAISLGVCVWGVSRPRGSRAVRSQRLEAQSSPSETAPDRAAAASWLGGAPQLNANSPRSRAALCRTPSRRSGRIQAQERRLSRKGFLLPPTPPMR